MNKEKVKKISARALIYIVLIVITIITLFPVVYTILGSFKGNLELLSEGNHLFPKKFVLDNYKQAWEMADFSKYTMNSVFMSGMIVLGTMISFTISGYVIARLQLRGTNL